MQQPLLACLFGGLLSIPFLDYEQYWLTWIAFLPLLLAIENASLVKTYGLGLLAGLCLFMSGTYWIVDFVMIAKGFSIGPSVVIALIVWLYCAHMIAFIAVLFKWLRRITGLHDFILFPVIVATFTSAYPMLFAMRLGESQINFYSALQATEWIGVVGLDAVIALFNIVVYSLLRQLTLADQKPSIREIGAKAIGLSIVALWLTYGAISFAQWEMKTISWDTLKIGIVQPNETPKLGDRLVYSGYGEAYPPEMEMTERLAGLGAELIVWPEGQAKGYLDQATIRTAYQENVRLLRSSLLFQDMQHVKEPRTNETLTQFNSAVMLDQRGREIGSYQKLKRIPFGEYLPWTISPMLKKQWSEALFGDFLTELSKGEQHQAFKHNKINIIPLICYETTFPSFVANAVKETAAQIDKTNGTVLIGLSNDGWFGSTHQPHQHIIASVLRAVENRLPLVHVANNGPSIVVSPSGRVTFYTDFQQAGGYLTDLVHAKSAQGSFYSRHPHLFENALYALMLIITLYALFNVTGARRDVDKD